MPRHPRLFIADIPLHIVQRGHDRQPVFVEPDDYAYYLANLAELKSELSVCVLGYCLMTNHVHLILMPGSDTATVSKLMRVVAARQTRLANKAEGRTGTLWDGRFKASLVDSEEYLLACYRYVDLNPVRARMVELPEAYRWSSYCAHAGLATSELVDDHPSFLALGGCAKSRGEAYRAYLREAIDEQEFLLIRSAVQRNQLTGNDLIRHAIERRVGRRIAHRGPGRPPKG